MATIRREPTAAPAPAAAPSTAPLPRPSSPASPRRRPPRPGAGNANSSWAASTWTGAWVGCILSNSSYCTSGGKDATIWDLDNEPGEWDAVHRDVHPQPQTYDELTNAGIGTALAIKVADPNAQISGPVIDLWWNYFYSKKDIESGWATGPCYQPWDNPTDREAHSGTPMIEYYIQQMAAASNTYGIRLLDYVDIHAYLEGSYNGAQVGFTSAGDTGEQEARINSTRVFWDSTYTDSNYPQPNYGGSPSNCTVPLQAPEVIPMMQSWIATAWTNTTYAAPGTAIDEYNFGGLESINGALTEADILGIFGKYGLTLAALWPTTNYTSQGPGNMAFEIYRNYDGAKSTFGDSALNANTTDQSKLSVYAGVRSSDNTVTIVVINKTYGTLTNTLSINNLTGSATSAQVYQYSAANLTAIVAQPAVAITPPTSGGTASTLSGTFPAQSITLFVIPQ